MAKTTPQNPMPGKVAQLLADTIIGLHPHVSTLAEKEKELFRAKFLDGLEEHTAKLAGPLLDAITNTNLVPDELTAVIGELSIPQEQFTGIISQFFIFGVLFTMGQSILAPFIQQINNDVWSKHADRPLSPADIATAVIRGISLGDSSKVPVPDWAFTEAAKSGLGEEAFSTMVGVAGMAPALQLLFEMIRRQIITEDQLTEGIKQGDVKDEWIPYVEKLRYVQPTPGDMVRAAVQDQWDSEPVDVTYSKQYEWAQKLGLEPAGYLDDNPNWFNILVNIAGRPPGPQEMARAANRGITDWDGRGSSSVSFSQAISESDIKNKYIGILKKLAVYFPPSSEVKTLLMHGGIDDSQAEKLWVANGVPADLAKAYMHLATVEQMTQDRALAKGDILTLVQEQALSDEAATELLQQIGYSGTNAVHLIEMAHYRYELETLRRVIQKVATLYTSRKITATQAKEGFQGLGMPESQIDAMMQILEHQREAQVLIPTAAEIKGGFKYGVIPQTEAITMLTNLGYDAWDAWFTLSVEVHAKLPDEPVKTQVE